MCRSSCREAALAVASFACEHHAMTRAVGRKAAVIAGVGEIKEAQDEAQG